MAVVFAVERIYDEVSARFAALGDTTPHVFGRRARAQVIETASRIQWQPGDPSGQLGDLTLGRTSRAATRNPRPLGTLDELVTVVISGSDATDPESELAQYHATRVLYDRWVACMHAVAHGTFTIESSRWLTDQTLRAYGAAIEVVFYVAATIHDTTTNATAPTPVRGLITVEELDHDETVETEPAPPEVDAVATTAITLSGEQTIDGVSLVAGDRVLAIAQADGKTNGVYAVAAGAWSRATGMDASAEVISGTFVRVLTGTEYGDTGYVLTTPDPIVLGTTSLTFTTTTPVQEPL